MKYTLIAASIAATLALTACSKSENPQVNQPQTEEAAATAQIGSFGVDLTARDMSVKPGDDFFMYASGTWYKNYELPADKTRFGAFSELADRSEEQVKQIIDDIMTSENLTADEQLVHDYYHAYMDTETINAKGITPIEPILAEIKSLSSIDALTTFFGKSWLHGASSPLWGGLWYNRLDPNEYQLTVGVSGLGLPDRDYYLSDAERFVDIRKAYLAHIEQMLNFAGEADAGEKAETILALETAIAEIQWPREKRRDRDLTLNQIAREELSDGYPNFNWNAWLNAQGYKAPELNISQPEPVKAVIEIINDTPLNDWKTYLTYHAISN
ncbi:MAG: M13 family peptidase, partial [Aestuariibacter sp.]|nr:M13 family peptidase [Aestuariibacter sp.]MCP4866078.1 M13 family peptidase [Alteromonas sp.]